MNKDDRMLIILTPGFPKDESDTTCLPFLQNFVKELGLQFPRLRVVVLAFDYPFMKSEYYWNHVRVVSFNGWKKNKVAKLVTWLSILRKLKKIGHERELAGILSFWCGECAFLGSRFARKNNLRHYCWIQGQDAKKENKYVSRMNPSAGELIAVSDFIKMEFGKNHKVVPAWVVPVGINPSEFDLLQPVRNIDILGVGSLIPLKQYHLFIEVIQHLKKYIPEIRGVICGQGQEESELKRLIEDMDLTENVTLMGEIPHLEVLQIMKRSKVFLHTSRYEGISVACQEALYAGCQVISFVRLMQYDIAHWQVCERKDQMVEYARSILVNPESVYSPVLTFTAEESVKKIMTLFS
jgi:glycosyltransferase involved in cell wall biosynthesis